MSITIGWSAPTGAGVGLAWVIAPLVAAAIISNEMSRPLAFTLPGRTFPPRPVRCLRHKCGRRAREGTIRAVDPVWRRRSSSASFTPRSLPMWRAPAALRPVFRGQLRDIVVSESRPRSHVSSLGDALAGDAHSPTNFANPFLAAAKGRERPRSLGARTRVRLAR